MNALIDTNVILDYMLQRQGFVEHSKMIFEKVFDGNINGYLSSNSITDIYYVGKKLIGKDDALEFVRDLVGQFEILDLTSSIIEGALTNKVDDFEDYILIESAKVNNIDIIITRNTKDFICKGVLVMEPKELMEKLGK